MLQERYEQIANMEKASPIMLPVKDNQEHDIHKSDKGRKFILNEHKKRLHSQGEIDFTLETFTEKENLIESDLDGQESFLGIYQKITDAIK